MSGRLQGKVAVVTGSSEGIGAAVALHCGREGASVVVDYSRNAEKAESVVADITKSGGRAIALQASMREAASLREQTPLKRFGKPGDIAPAVGYLASEKSAWMTGEFIVLGGGQR